MKKFLSFIVCLFTIGLAVACGALHPEKDDDSDKVEASAPCACEACECYEDGSCTCTDCQCEGACCKEGECTPDPEADPDHQDGGGKDDHGGGCDGGVCKPD